MTDLPSGPYEQTGATPPLKPALAPGVKSQVMLPNAAQPSGPGLAAGSATFNPGAKPGLGVPKPRLRAIEPLPTPAAASYKVSLPETTNAQEAVPVSHVFASGLAAAIAIATAFLIFLKF